MAGPTRNEQVEGQVAWRASPNLSFIVRAVAFLIPLVGAWAVVRLVSGFFVRPDGNAGLAIWIVQAIVVGSVAAMVIDRGSRRLLPLAALFNLSLVFPDEAPSRFSLALRMGSVKKLRERERARASLGSETQQAAELAVEMVMQLGVHDRLTRGHSERVRAYADLIGEELELEEWDRARLSWAALLHDVGKMEVPAEILNKDGRPSDEEWEVLARHPEHSAQQLGPLVVWLGPWIGAATEHHERWDGAGYPNGLAGHDISLAGRITAVADAYDTMTSKRSYKQPSAPEAARRELVACSGTQFDPEVVRAFLNVSLGRRWLAGPFAWLAELPRLASFSNGLGAVPSAVLSSVVVAGSFGAGLVTPSESGPVELAFREPTTAASPVETTSSSTSPSTTRPTLSRPTEEPSTSVPTTVLSPSTSSTSTTIPTDTTGSSTSAAPDTTTAAPTTSTTRPPSTTTTTTAPTTTTTAGSSTTTTTAPSTTTTTIPPGSPLVVADVLTVEQGDDEKSHVLDNDDSGNAAFDVATLEIITAPQHADDFRVHNDHIHYEAASDYIGVDQLEYRICNLNGLCATGWLTITVEED